MGAFPVPLPGSTAQPASPARPVGVTRRGLGPTRLGRCYLLIAAALMVAGTGGALLQAPLWHPHPLLASVNVATSLTFICTGLILRRDGRHRAVAWALVLAGVLRSLDFSDALGGPFPFYTLVFGGMDRLAGAYALLRYPSAALTRNQRLFVWALGGWMVIGRLAATVTSRPVWDNYPPSSWWLELGPDRHLAGVLTIVSNAGQGVLGLTLLVLLIMRLVQTRGLDRLVITPIIVAGLAAVAAAIGTAVTQMLSDISATPNGAYVMEGIVDLALPLAFGVAVVQSALLLRSIPGLATSMSAGADLAAVRFALRTTLRDPTLEIVDLTPARPEAGSEGRDGPIPALAAQALGLEGGESPGADLAGLADLADRTGGGEGDGPALAVAGAQPPDRLVELIRTEGGAPIAVVIADPGLARYRGLFSAAVQTSGLALKNAQLQARAAQLELGQVRASRARLVEAGLAERRRLERDLHDGAQQHLLALAAQLSVEVARTGDPAAAAALRRAQAELTAVLGELRDLAHGIHPAILTEAGLAAALDEVAERLPVPVRLAVPGGRAAPAVEATAYFVACEALANVIKHAGASEASVTIELTASELIMEIADDGLGGAGPGGRGLANMLDRAGALDGDLSVHSPAGQGTRITARIPCG